MLIGLLTVLGAFVVVSKQSIARTCGSCHTNVTSTKGTFSHARHAKGRSCRSCHDVQHSKALLMKAQLNMAEPSAAAGAAARRTLSLPKDSAVVPAALTGHRSVSCSTCHDMPSMTCGECHSTPKEKHFGQRCSVCHSPSRPFAQPRMAHPTFGVHTSIGDQTCESCHASGGSARPACRTCHQQDCGQGVTTIAGCMKCHKKGSSKDWLSGL